MTAAVPAGLSELLERWLPGQRWFAGKGRQPRLTDVRKLGELTEHPHRSAVWLVRVGYPDGGAETYQVPLVRRTEPSDTLAHVLLGELTDPETGEPTWWYDALHDKEVTGAWLAAIETGRRDDTLAFVPGPGAGDLPLEAASLVIPNEQSNTSLVYDDVAILKVFRRPPAGVNPDIEVHEALSRLDGGPRHAARLLGYVTGRWPAGAGDEVPPDADGRVEGSLAMLQEFFRTATDGWDLAQISVRDLYAEADLHADEVGGDFAGEAYRLGVATAEVHDDLARALPTGVFDAGQVARLAAGMRARLDAAVVEVPALAEFVPGLHAAFDDLAGWDRPVGVQRIHGDYHLGQVLRTVHRWVVLDFEGEPATPVDQRRRPDSPVRDVAGMLRSFDYAARHQLADRTDPQLGYRADEWSDRNRTAFCDGYAEASGRDPRDEPALLRAYEADKAVYEAVYEARNRPSWLVIPLASLARLTGAAAT